MTEVYDQTTNIVIHGGLHMYIYTIKANGDQLHKDVSQRLM